MKTPRPESIIASAVLILIIISLLIMWSLRANAEVVTLHGVCTTPTPCTSWRFTLPRTPVAPPALYLTGYDFDSPDEGSITINGHVVPLFGPSASTEFNDPAHALGTRTIGYQTEAGWWTVGDNVLPIAWRTDATNDPAKHEVTAASLQVNLTDEWSGPFVCLRKGSPAKFLWGFHNNSTGVNTTFALEYTPALDARLRAFLGAYRAGSGAGPLNLTGIVQLPVSSDDIVRLWSNDSSACSAP